MRSILAALLMASLAAAAAAGVATPTAADAAPVYGKQLLNRDGAHHHHHHHHQPQHQYHHPQPQQPQHHHHHPPPQQQQQQQHYHHPQQHHEPAAPAYQQLAAPAYSLDVDEDDSYAAAPLTGAGGYAAAPTAVEEAQPSYYDPSGPTYSTPGHTGYYYYYYPLKPNKFKLRMPSLSKIMSGLHLPEYIGKDGSEGGSPSMKTAAAVTSLLVAATGLFLGLPMLGAGFGRRSDAGPTDAAPAATSREHMKALGQYVTKLIERYEYA